MATRNIDLVRQHLASTRDGISEKRPIAVIVPHDDIESRLLSSCLGNRGYQVIRVSSASAALRTASAEKLDLVVCALEMPDLNGSQLLERIRALRGCEETPFLFISPAHRTPDHIIGHETFANDYVHRPIDVREFERRLDGMVRFRKAAIAGYPAQTSKRPKDPGAEQFLQEATAELPEAPGTAESLTQFRTSSAEGVDQTSVALCAEAFLFLTKATMDVRAGEPIDLRRAFEITSRIVAHLTQSEGLVKLALDREAPFAFRRHSINVAIISARIARTLGWSDERVNQVTLAGLLHDIGTLKLPPSMTSKTFGFTDADRHEIQRRPLYSAELLSGFAGFEWLPKIVVQAHERENGRGYPHGLKGWEICQEAKILNVADVFEACLHQRPHRAALTGYRALQVITSEVDSFSETITKAMMRSFSIYPYNEYVLLNTGEIGVVTDINLDNPLRPVVKILRSAGGAPMVDVKTINLARNSQLWITAALTRSELP